MIIPRVIPSSNSLTVFALAARGILYSPPMSSNSGACLEKQKILVMYSYADPYKKIDEGLKIVTQYYFLKILRSELARALSQTLLNPLWKSSSAMTRSKGLHKDTAPERRQASDSCNHTRDYKAVAGDNIQSFFKFDEYDRKCSPFRMASKSIKLPLSFSILLGLLV